MLDFASNEAVFRSESRYPKDPDSGLSLVEWFMFERRVGHVDSARY